MRDEREVVGGPEAVTREVFPDQVLRTARLTLRGLREDDADAIVAAVGDPVTQRWLPLPDPYSRAEALPWVRDAAPAARTSGKGLIRAPASPSREQPATLVSSTAPGSTWPSIR